MIFGTRSLPWGRMKLGSHFWKLLQTIPFTELMFQSYSIQTYVWLCSSSACQNVKSLKIYSNQYLFKFSKECHLQSLLSEFLYHLCSYSWKRTKSKHCSRMCTVGQCIFQKKLALQLFFYVINCAATKMSCKSKNSHKHQESHFICRSQCSNNVNNLREIHTSEKRTEPNWLAEIQT